MDIAGTSFVVDVLHDELRQADNVKNAIPFAAFDQEGDGYTFLYDSRIKNVPEKTPLTMEPGLQWVTIPALMELDPEGIALKYDIPLSILCPDLHSILNQREEEDNDDEDWY